MLGGAHNIREHTRSVINEYIDRMDAPDRDGGLGSHLNLPEDMKGIKVDSGSRKVFDGADYDKTSRGHKESQRAIEMDVQCRENGRLSGRCRGPSSAIGGAKTLSKATDTMGMKVGRTT